MALESRGSDSDFSDEDVSPLEKNFNQAAEHVRKLTSKLDNQQLLQLYGLYKQGTEGQCNIPKPGWLDSWGRRKWEAWKENGAMDIDEAREKYIGLVLKLDPSLTIQSEHVKESWVAVSSLRRSPEPDLDFSNLSLLELARENHGERVKQLLDKNPLLKDEKDEDGLTALHWAADRNATEAMTAAISGGCDLDAVDNSGQTALHYAASCGHTNATKLLLDAGASTKVKDSEGNTPVDMVTDDCVKDLLENAK